jgi:putative chitinase
MRYGVSAGTRLSGATMINRKFFFDYARQTLFTGKLTRAQVAGLGFILDVWETAHRRKDDRWLAYALATAYHETGFTMQPIREIGGRDYFLRMYDPQSPLPKRAALARAMGARPGDGVVFYGRGYVQLTWRRNYDLMGKTFKVDLTSTVEAADRALQPALAAQIMFKGMEEGLFTGKKLADYFEGQKKQDWRNARRIINGNDQDEAIALFAQRFYACISYTTD